MPVSGPCCGLGFRAVLWPGGCPVPITANPMPYTANPVSCADNPVPSPAIPCHALPTPCPGPTTTCTKYHYVNPNIPQ